MPKAPRSTEHKEQVQFKFKYQPAQMRMYTTVQVNGGSYLRQVCPQVLEVGGQRSGKTQGKLYFGVTEYCLKFNYCDILVLRRTHKELEGGPIQDFKTIFKPMLENGDCVFHEGKHIATFANGSRVVFGSCPNNRIRDIEQYLGQGYPYILVDECGQFSPDAWEYLSARNLVNAGCEPDQFGNLPIPCMAGCTNPVGEYWDFYHTLFAKHAALNTAGIGKGEPWLVDADETEEHKPFRRADASWWRKTADGQAIRVYDPRRFGVNHSTMLDNQEFQRRDPQALARLQALSPAKQKKFLYGLLEKIGGQYFTCFSPYDHVINLKDDPLAILWRPHERIWAGQDWGMGHWNAFYLFTQALVRSVGENEYKLRTVCFAEVSPTTTGLTSDEFAVLIDKACYYPRLPEDHPQYHLISGKRAVPQAIYFSHEKFSRIMEAHSPADEYSQKLSVYGLPPVSMGTRDPVGSAMFMYSCFKHQNLVILSTCQGIIQAIPQLQTDEKNLDKVRKVNNIADDRYDAFRLGLYGEMSPLGKTKQEKHKEYMDTLDPWLRWSLQYRVAKQGTDDSEIFKPTNYPSWWGRVSE